MISTTEDLLNAYRSRLKLGARRMLNLLVEAYPAGFLRQDLGTNADVDPNGGTFSSYLSDLRRNQLIDERDGLVFANANLYLFEG